MENDVASGSREARPMLSRLSFIKKPAVLVLLFIAVTVTAYSNTFDVPFQFDDEMSISMNPLVTSVSNIPTILEGSKGPFASRPIMHASFTLNYYFGKLNPRGYHIVNLILHLINGVLLYLLVTRTLSLAGYEPRQRRTAAVIASMVFLLHPVQTEGVTYVISRSTLFATMFFMLGLMLYAKAATAERRRWLYVAALFVVSLLGMGSRENFATFAVMVIAYDVIFITKLDVKATLRHYRAYVPVFLSVAYLAYIILNNTYDVSGEFNVVSVPPVDYFFTEFKVQWTYLRLLVLPLNQNIDYDYPISHSLFEPATLAAMIGYLGLWVFALRNAKKRPVASFSLLWFLVTLIPISFGVTVLGLRLDDVIFEHRLYLPGAGIIMGASVAATRALEMLKERKRGIALAAIVIVLVPSLGAATFARNSVWRSDFSLWRDAALKSPGKPRPENNLGRAYAARGYRDKAIEHYKRALAIDPDFGDTLYNLGLAYSEEGHADLARKYYEKAVAVRPDMADAQINLGNIYLDMGRPDLAVERYKAALKQIPMFSIAHVDLGNAYVALGQYDKAIEHFMAAIKIKPYDSGVYNNLANAYYLDGQTEEANKYFKKAMDLQRMGR